MDYFQIWRDRKCDIHAAINILISDGFTPVQDVASYLYGYFHSSYGIKECDEMFKNRYNYMLEDSRNRYISLQYKPIISGSIVNDWNEAKELFRVRIINHIKSLINSYFKESKITITNGNDKGEQTN